MMPMAQGLGFSIPLDAIKSAIARINQHRNVTPLGGSLGVGGMRIVLDEQLRRSLSLTQAYGMELLEIRPGGPAERAELKRMDIIVSADSAPVTEPRDLQQIVRRHAAGQKLVVSFLRGGKLRKVTAIL
jgi:S1-C subfamily serine protease